MAQTRRLRDRAVRIIMQAVGVSRQKVEGALEASGGEVKSALLMLLCGCNPESAARLLRQEPNMRAAQALHAGRVLAVRP